MSIVFSDTYLHGAFFPGSSKVSTIFSRRSAFFFCCSVLQVGHSPHRGLTEFIALVLGLLRAQGASISGYLNDLLLREQSVPSLK